MDPVTRAALASWHIDAWLVASSLVGAGLYGRGWLRLHRQMPERFTAARAGAFAAGLAALFVALASPLDAFSGFLLQAHMAQHLLLMMVAPPLLLLGLPTAPLLRGLPVAVATGIVGPLIASPPLRTLARLLSHPIVCWAAFVATTWAWHVPYLYTLALYSPAWHAVEHLSFLATALLFWWPVIEPWPTRRRLPAIGLVAYLLSADLQNTVLSALFCFSERILYPAYAAVPRLWNITAADDQVTAGVLMWVPGSIAFLIPVGVIVARMIDAGGEHRRVRPRDVLAGISLVALAVLAGRASADGGRMLAAASSDDLRVSVFSATTPIRRSHVDLSVMVQPADDWRPLLDADVELVLTPAADLPVAQPLRVAATRTEAHNKLLYAAHLHLPAAGRWEVTARVRDRGIEASFQLPAIDVVEPSNAGWQAMALGLTCLAAMLAWPRKRRSRCGHYPPPSCP